MKITIDNEEVLCNKDFTINEEMLNTSSVILNNVYPATWEQDKDYVSRFYYPKDYSKCKIFNEIEHPEEKSTAEGTSFSIEVDTTKQYEIQTLKGQTSQSSPQPINITTGRQVVSVCGKNLLYKDFYQSSANAIKCELLNFPSGTFTWSFTNQNIPGEIQVKTKVNGSYQTYANAYSKNQLTFTLNTSQDIQLESYRAGGNPLSNYSNMMINKGQTALPYEEYKGGTYEINLGKNLFDKDNANILQMNLAGSSTTSGLSTSNRVLYIPIEPSTTYTIQKIRSTYFTIGTTTTTPNYNMSYTRLVAGGTATQETITTNSSARFLIIWYYNSGSDTSLTEQEILDSIQIEKGSSASSFSPYKTPIYLGKIGTYQDYIFRNTTENPLYDSNLEEGQWYIHKEIGRYDFTGTENFSASQWGTNSWDLIDIISTPYNTNELQIMSNIFKGVAHKDRSTSGNNIIYTFSNNGFEIRNTTYSTLTDIRNATKGNYIYYVLNTPKNTLIEDEELINQLNSIELLEGLNNVSVSSANLPFIMSLLYNYVPEYTEEDLLFCGVVENTGNVSLNPRYPHYCNLQVLDFKTFLSEGETLDFVIYEKTILEAINQVIGTISDYGFVLGNVNILHEDEVIGAYSTKDKTAYDVFNYIADITQSRWTTRMVDENIVAIDFYDPSLMPHGTAIDYTQEWFCNNKIIDMSFSYSSRDYRNKQVMLSGEVYANIETTEVIIADGYQTQFNTIDKIGYVSSILLNGNPATIITKEEYNLGYEGDFIYQPGNQYFESVDLISTGAVITIVYFAIIEGREIILNQEEISRVSNMTDRKGIIARYENRNDATTTSELQAIGQSYLKYKGSPEVSLKIDTLNNIWNIGEKVSFSAPLTELTTEYMVKKKTINYITTQDNIFYSYELSSNFNSETEINYFDNQRSKMMGNIGQGEYISRNIDIENTANIIFYDLEVEEVQLGDNTLQSELQTTLGVE